MSLCILAAGKITVLAGSLFTLSWTHSVEATRWEERWQATPTGLKLVEARVKGSGAGVDPPPEARLEHDWWVWQPALPQQTSLMLATSGATRSGWRLCGTQGCIDLREDAPSIQLKACSDGKRAANEAYEPQTGSCCDVRKQARDRAYNAAQDGK